MPEKTEKKNEELIEAIEDLDQNIEDLDKNIHKLDHRFTVWQTFGRGIVGSLGALIGATIVVALFIYILQRLAVLPLIGDFFSEMLEYLRRINDLR